MRKVKLRRLFSVFVCFIVICSLSVPAFAASDDLGYQYVFEKDFTFSEIAVSDTNSSWYFVPLDVSTVADRVDADGVEFSIDDYTYRTSFKTAVRAVTYHYIGNGGSVFGIGDDTGDPYLFVVCPDDSSRSGLYLHSELVGPLYHGDAETVHIAMSVAYDDVLTVPSLMDDVSSLFRSAVTLVGAVAGTVVGNPILLLPVVVGLCGIGVAFYHRLKR